MPTLAGADLRAGLGISHGAVAAVALSVPLLLSWLVEPALLLAATRVGRRCMAAAGFAVMALGALGAAQGGGRGQAFRDCVCSA